MRTLHADQTLPAMHDEADMASCDQEQRTQVKKKEATQDQRHVWIIRAANQGLCAKDSAALGMQSLGASSVELQQKEVPADSTHTSQF